MSVEAVAQRSAVEPAVDGSAPKRPADPRVSQWLDQARVALNQWRGQSRPARRAALERRMRSLIERAARRQSDARLVAFAIQSLHANPTPAQAQWTLEQSEHLATSPREHRHLAGWAAIVGGDRRAGVQRLIGNAGLNDAAGADVLRNAATWLIDVGDLELAELALVHARRALPTDATLSTDLAAVRLARGDPRGAIRVLREEIRHHGADTDFGSLLREDLAGAYLAAGRGAEAVTLWKRVAAQVSAATQPDPERRQRLHRAVARAALELGDNESALTAAQSALDLAQDDGEAQLLLGLALAAAGRDDQAITALRRAARLLPSGDPRVRGALEGLTGGDVPGSED